MMTDEATALSGHESSQSKMMEELCLLVDEYDVVIGNESKLGCHHGKGIRHRAFSVLIFE